MNINAMMPHIVEETRYGERRIDIYSQLFSERIIFLGTGIDSNVANSIVAQLLVLDSQDPEKPIRMYINSPGGVVYAGLAIYDAMQQVSAPISTVAVGSTASFGTVILTAGTKGMRYALPNATIHMHQPLGGAQGQASDIAIAAQEILRLRTNLNNILAHHMDQDIETIIRDTDRDIFMTANQAQEYGIVDEVLKNPADIPII